MKFLVHLLLQLLLLVLRYLGLLEVQSVQPLRLYLQGLSHLFQLVHPRLQMMWMGWH